MDETFYWVVIFTVMAALVNSLGIFTISKYEYWVEKTKNYFMCFAAGVLISTPLVLALPNAFQTDPNAGFIALAGFLFMFFSNELIQKFTRKDSLAFGITAAEGIGIHSFIDGVIYAITFNVNIVIGLLAGIGLVVHEFAEGVITFSVLIKGGVSKKKARYYAFLIAALTTPIGALIAYPLISNLSESILGSLLGFVAGVLLYVSASHLLPEARELEKGHSMLAFIAGIALALFIVLTKID